MFFKFCYQWNIFCVFIILNTNETFLCLIHVKHVFIIATIPHYIFE